MCKKTVEISGLNLFLKSKQDARCNLQTYIKLLSKNYTTYLHGTFIRLRCKLWIYLKLYIHVRRLLICGGIYSSNSFLSLFLFAGGIALRISSFA